MMLPSLKTMNVGGKLTVEVVKDAAKYKLWMRKFEAWLSSQAGSLNMEVEPFFKRVSEAKINETTKELFEELKMRKSEQVVNWIKLSGELQSALVFLCEGEPLQIVEQTQLEVADGK